MMRILKYPLILLIVAFIVSCTSDDKLESRIKALERRVAALEVGSSTANRSSDRPVQLANNPQAVEDNSPKSVMAFENMEFDFGTINEGEVIEHTFTFTNTSEVPLIIEKATASCGCTVPKWPKDPILPGGTGDIDVRFDSKNKPNQQIKTITISANTEPAITRLRIKGFVTPQQQSAGPVK